jgi:hypothetical protein
VVDPTPTVDLPPAACSTPGVRPPVIPCPLDCPLQDYPLLVCCIQVHHLLVCPPPVAATLGGLFCGRLQGLNDHNPITKWVSQSWLMWHHHAMYVASCVRYRNEDKHTIRILDFWGSHGTIQCPKLQDVRLLGRAGVRYISLIYKAGGLPQSLP